MTNTEIRPQDIAEATKIEEIMQKWRAVNPEMMIWTVTLASGRQITTSGPLGAAVEVETAGHHIRAIDETADNTLDGWPLLPGEGLLGPARR